MTLNFLSSVLLTCCALTRLSWRHLAPRSRFSSPQFAIPSRCTTPAVHALVSILPPPPESYFFSSPASSIVLSVFYRSGCLFVCFAAVTTINPHIILSPFFYFAQPILLIPRHHFCSVFPPSPPHPNPIKSPPCVVFTPFPLP